MAWVTLSLPMAANSRVRGCICTAQKAPVGDDRQTDTRSVHYVMIVSFHAVVAVSDMNIITAVIVAVFFVSTTSSQPTWDEHERQLSICQCQSQHLQDDRLEMLENRTSAVESDVRRLENMLSATTPCTDCGSNEEDDRQQLQLLRNEIDQLRNGLAMLRRQVGLVVVNVSDKTFLYKNVLNYGAAHKIIVIEFLPRNAL